MPVRVLVAGLFAAVFATSSVLAQRDQLREAGELVKLGQYDRALVEVDAYLKERPKDARGRFMKGLILAEQKKSDEAIEVFTDLTRDYPELPEPYNNLAVLYANQGQYDKARSSLELAIRTHPSYATAHENLGDVYAKMASQAYDKALQFDTGNRTAKTKLNLIRELFSSAPGAKASERASGDVRVATKPAAKTATEPLSKKVTTAPVSIPAAGGSTNTDKTKPADNDAKDKATARSKPVRNPQAVLEVVTQWAKAWSDNDVGTYLTHYAPDFEPPKGMSRAAWEAQRKARIGKPRKIEVTIERPKVTFADENRAKVTFLQRYSSDTFKATGTKTLQMVKQGDKWLIKKEEFKG